MEVKARTFKQLEKEKTFKELNQFAKEVTEAYATSSMEYSQTNAANDNCLTKKGLRDLMDYAIKTALVSLDTANLILNKATSNQQRKTQEAGSSSINHHKKLMRARVEYLVGAYLNEEINKIATDIANEFSYSIIYFTKKYDIESETLTRRILERSIVENIVSDDIMEKIIERSLAGNKSERAKKYFEYLRSQREKNKSKNS